MATTRVGFFCLVFASFLGCGYYMPVLALLILSGKQARKVWALTALFMFLLTFGQTILMKPDVIANWQYLVLTLVCAALSDSERRNLS